MTFCLSLGILVLVSCLTTYVRGQCVGVDLEAKRYARDITPRAFTGSGVAVHGTTVVAGAYGHTNFTGTAYVFSRVNGTWVQEAQITPTQIKIYDQFSFMAPAIHGDTIVLNAVNNDRAARNAGLVFVYRKQALGQWTNTQILEAPKPRAGDRFGISISVSDRDMAVAADFAGGNKQGAVYLYRYNKGEWVLRGSVRGEVEGDQFGEEVLINGNWMIVGAIYGSNKLCSKCGRAYAYEKVDNVWQFRQYINSPDGVTGDRFSTGVALSTYGTLVLGSSKGTGRNNLNEGAAYVFQLSGGRWRLEQKLMAYDGKLGDEFGGRAAIDPAGGIIAVAANRDGTYARQNGAVYIFTKCDLQSWTLTTKLYAPQPKEGDRFGLTPAMTENLLVVPNPREDRVGEDMDSNDGAMYLYNITRMPESTRCSVVRPLRTISSDTPLVVHYRYATSDRQEVFLSIRRANGDRILTRRNFVTYGFGVQSIVLETTSLQNGTYQVDLSMGPADSRRSQRLCEDIVNLQK